MALVGVLHHGTMAVMRHGDDGGHATWRWSGSCIMARWQSCAMVCIQALGILLRPAFLAGL
jgi:hypothetical protein